MKKVIVFGTDMNNSSKASSIRVRNLFDSIVNRDDYFVSNILYLNTDSNSTKKIASNIELITKKGVFKYFSIFTALFNYRFGKEKTVIYNYGSVSYHNISILIWAKLIGIPIFFDIVENNQGHVDKKTFLHIPKQKFNSYFGKKLHLFATKIFVISKNLENLIGGFSGGKVPIVHIPISVRMKEWEFFEEEKQKAKQVIFYGGSFGPKDGLKFLIEAFDRVSRAYPNVELHLSGLGVKRHVADTLNLIEKAQSDKIKYLGPLNRDEYVKKICTSDIVCVTRINSVFANYGFPFKLGEYLAAGRCIIASDVSDVSLYLNHKEDVWLVKPESVEEIELGLNNLLSEPQLRKQMGVNAYQKAINHFDSLLVGELFRKELETW